MPNPLLGVAGASAVGGILSSRSQSKAAERASDSQVAATQLGIDEQRRQFDITQEQFEKIREDLAPYMQAGEDALSGQLALLGLGGEEAQQAAIDAIERGPAFRSMVRTGEDAILANASATGGLRGGNTQGALAQFRPQVLNSLIDQQYGRLGGLAGMGQASAVGTGAAAQGIGSAAMSTGANISNLLQQRGAAQAGGALARGEAAANAWGSITEPAGFLAGQIKMPDDAGLFDKWGF